MIMVTQIVQVTWLWNRAGLLKTIAGFIVPEVQRSIVSTAHTDTILIYCQRIDRGSVAAKILKEPR